MFGRTGKTKLAQFVERGLRGIDRLSNGPPDQFVGSAAAILMLHCGYLSASSTLQHKVLGKEFRKISFDDLMVEFASFAHYRVQHLLPYTSDDVAKLAGDNIADEDFDEWHSEAVDCFKDAPLYMAGFIEKFSSARHDETIQRISDDYFRYCTDPGTAIDNLVSSLRSMSKRGKNAVRIDFDLALIAAASVESSTTVDQGAFEASLELLAHARKMGLEFD